METPMTNADTKHLENSNLVHWTENDCGNPHNWSFGKRWLITAVAAACDSICTISTSMIATALPSIGQDLGVPSTASFEGSLAFSIFVLAFGLGPFLVSPLAEIYGRRWVNQFFLLWYLAFNTACGFAQTGPQLVVLRFFAGLGGSAPPTIGVAMLSDIWTSEERGLSIGLYGLITLLTPALGPLLGGFITQYAYWRWTFWSISIAGVPIQLLAFFFLRETFPPVLLDRRVKDLRKTTGNWALHTKWSGPHRSPRNIALESTKRPLKLLATQPITQVLVLYQSYLYGLTFLALSTFSDLWKQDYGESMGISGLNYLSLAIGYTIGTYVCWKAIDASYRILKRQYNGVGKPEHRLPVLIVGSLFVPIGLVWYGWSAQYHLHWMMPNVGAVIFAAGIKCGAQCMQIYALDVYPTWSAAAIAAISSVRSLFGFTFPIFAPYMYNGLGYGWGNSILGLVAAVIGLPAAIGLWYFGPWLRAHSRYAAGE